MASCASVGRFQCLLFGLPDITLLRERERRRETREQCAEHVFFRTVAALFRPEGQLSDPDPQKEQLGRGTHRLCVGAEAWTHSCSYYTVKHSHMFVSRLPGQGSCLYTGVHVED